MAQYYDDEGNEIEGVLSPEEAKALQERTAELEAKAQKAEELEAALKAKEEELTKLAGKDMNFKRLRDKTEAEVEELKEKMSEKEKVLLAEVMELTKERDSEKAARTQEATKRILDSLSGGDETLRKSIEVAEKELVGEAKTEQELEVRLRKAFILVQGTRPAKNPIYSGYAASYSDPDVTPKKFTETEEGQASLKAWFPNIADKIYPEK